MRKNYYLLAIFIFTWLLICKLECSKADVQNSEINGRFRPWTDSQEDADLIVLKD